MQISSYIVGEVKNVNEYNLRRKGDTSTSPPTTTVLDSCMSTSKDTTSKSSGITINIPKVNPVRNPTTTALKVSISKPVPSSKTVTT